MTTNAAAPSAQPDTVVTRLFAEADQAFLSSAISREEGSLLRSLAARPDIYKTIEIGCANGISAIYICSGLQGKPGASHTAIDPFQYVDFDGRGVANVSTAGFDFFRLIAERSELALPELLRKGDRFDLAFIDGLHTADQTMIDFYFVDRLLRPGGIVVFDDVNSPAVNRVARYALTYPNYRLIATVGPRGMKRRTINIAKKVLRAALVPFRKAAGEALCREFFNVSVTGNDVLSTVDFHSMVALEKAGDFERNTNWFEGI